MKRKVHLLFSVYLFLLREPKELLFGSLICFYVFSLHVFTFKSWWCWQKNKKHTQSDKICFYL